jgi:hypothetical protein
LAFVAALVVALITGFHLYVYDLILLLPAILLAVGSWQWSRKTRRRTVLNTSIAPLYLPAVHLLLGHWNRLCLLWLPLFAFALAFWVLLGLRHGTGAQGF